MDTRLGLISAYSFLCGVHKSASLLDKAQSFGVKTVSICDLNNLYGVHSFLEDAKTRNIRPVIGAALSLHSFHSSLSSFYHIHCFVQNRAGFGRLCEILSIRAKDIKNFDPLPLLQINSSGLVLASSNPDALSKLNGNVKNLFVSVTPDNLKGIEAHRKLNLPLAFLDTSAFLEKEDSSVHRVLRAIGLNKTTGNLKPEDIIAPFPNPQEISVLKTDACLRRFLDSWPQAVKGTEKIAQLCVFNEIFNGFIFPSYGDNPASLLRERVFKGAVLRYGELGDMEIDRIEYELETIEKMGFAPYFLRMDDIVNIANTANDNRTCGRGSGAASIVSYALGITNVDPIAHNLYFERFLSTARPDPPDIDVDFAWDERDELIKTVIKKFGSDYCARVANHNFFRPRSALRETAKAYGFSDAQISKLERRLFDLRENINDNEIDPLWHEIKKIASQIEGLPRGLSMHCGGIVITGEPVNRYAPIEKSLEGFPLLAWEKEGTEAAGFVKIDLLGNRSLAVIRDAVNNVENNIRDEALRERLRCAIHDKAVIDALSRGDSIGVFYIESPAMRQLQKKTGAGDFDHIVIHSSIIRPAANKFISEYVSRLKGKKWKPLHPRLDKILSESYGILCYQEDVSKTAVALAGFDEEGADKLRKVIAKKAGAQKLRVYENQFFEGCRKNNVNEKTINEIWSMMLSFDGYSFCKPHSASYAMVSFQSAYLRVHHPSQFMAAVLSNQGGYYRAHAYISECRRMELITEGPDINISQWKYYGKENRVVIGFMAIKGLSVTGVNEITQEREKNGFYKNLDDFIHRVNLSRDDIVSLCPSGVFDSICPNLSRPIQARMLLEMRSIKNETGSNDLFSSEPVHTASQISCLPSATSNILQEEYESLGFLRNAHPLTLWKDALLEVKNRIKASHITQYIGRKVKIIGWPVTQKDVWTKDGLTMCFLSLEDETAMYETVIFPEIYDRYNKLLFDQLPLLVYGSVENDQGAVILEVDKIEQL